ncbi:MAG: hypothetical protein IK092_04520 [Muribaculaceae bacterium]|nr:hypothetical protein [Muribaculaceae bacterium]
MNEKTRMRRCRDQEFLDFYNEALSLMLSKGVKGARKAAIDYTIHNARPKFYVNFERAYIVVCDILNKNRMPVTSPTMQAMWTEIAQLVRNLIGSSNMSISAALPLVLNNCRASRFYISEKYVYRYLYQATRERKYEKLKRFKHTA